MLQSPLTQPPSPQADPPGVWPSPQHPPLGAGLSPPYLSERASRAHRRALLTESARVTADLRDIFTVLHHKIQNEPRVASAQPACPVCLEALEAPAGGLACADCCACHDSVRLRCCGGDLHRGCLLRYTRSQFETNHFKDAMQDVIAWSMRGEVVDTCRVVGTLAARGEFSACPLCRAPLFFERPAPHRGAAPAPHHRGAAPAPHPTRAS